jgi:3-hexulose-6-phosphate synthase
MKLQLAIDMADTDQALRMAAQIHDVVDIIEIGTPMIVREGMVPVRAMKKEYPDAIVLADVKIVDGGAVEAGYAFEAGADIVTVLAVAADETIADVLKTARQFARRTMADMITVRDAARRAVELDKLGLDIICVHTAVDVQWQGRSPYADLSKIKPLVTYAKTAVAGGAGMGTIPLIKSIGADLVVVGSALTGAADLRRAAFEMKKLMS